MRIAVYLPLILPLFMVPFARVMAERLPPRAAVWLLTVVAVVLAGFSSAAVGLVVLAGAAQVPLVARLGHWSIGGVRHALDPGASFIAVLGVVVIVAAVVAVGRVVVRYVEALARNRTALRGAARDCELVVLPDAVPVAYALPGRPAHVIVSTGMLSALGPREQRALLAHERAHLAGRHHLITTAARIAAMVNPLLRPLHTAVEYAVERQADEAAAREIGDRSATARAIAKAALAARHAPAAPAPLLGVTTGPVPRRIMALMSPASGGAGRVRGLAALAAVGTLVISAAATLEATTDLHALLEIAQAATGH
jgi:Zn-dependent protease with chaperone function